MSPQIGNERKRYYQILGKIQQGTKDVTIWSIWFLNWLLHTLEALREILDKALCNHDFWNTHAKGINNPELDLVSETGEFKVFVGGNSNAELKGPFILK